MMLFLIIHKGLYVIGQLARLVHDEVYIVEGSLQEFKRSTGRYEYTCKSIPLTEDILIHFSSGDQVRLIGIDLMGFDGFPMSALLEEALVGIYNRNAITV